jgi:hypothetical protein
MGPTNHQLSATRAASKNPFSFSTYALIVALPLILSAVCARAQSDTPTAAGTSEGEKMERQMWADFKAKDWKAVESKIAEGFQSIHPDGARNRAGEIALIKNLNLGEISLSNFKSTVNEDNIVVTYLIAVQEMIDGKQLSRKPAPRLSVWKKGTHGWQWICLANLYPIT